MPDGQIAFLKQERLLSYEKIAGIVEILAEVGVRKVRLTGGEPLMRSSLENLVSLLARIPKVEEIALTTNAMLLANQAARLFEAGLKRVNISLDTLLESNFHRISRREGLAKVFEGIEAAIRVGMKVRINALVMRSMNLSEVPDLVRYAHGHGLPIRFIEFMPLDADRNWSRDEMVSGSELRSLLEKCFSRLLPMEERDPSQPATDYRFEREGGIVGFIDSVSQPFCQSCDRIRLTAEGKLRNCLFGQEEWDLSPCVVGFSEIDREAILRIVRECILNKHASHGISQSGFHPPQRAMYQIGG